MRAVDFSAPIEIKLAADTGALVGYASTFGNVDRVGDVCAPGCFAASLAEHKASGTMPAMLWSHDIGEPVGVWTEATEDSHGLKIAGRLTTGTQRGAEARALAKDSALSLSIGYRTNDAEYRDGWRVLKDLTLYEVSLVSIPANPEARISSIKSLGLDADEVRDAIAFEKFLRKSGFPNSLARRLAAGWDEATGRRDADEAFTEIIAAIKSSAAKFRKG